MYSQFESQSWYVFLWRFHHDPAANGESLEHAGGKKHLPRSHFPGSTDNLHLSLLIKKDSGLNFQVFSGQQEIIRAQPAQFGERSDAFIVPVLHHQPSGRKGEEEHPEEQDPGRNELKDQWHSLVHTLNSRLGEACMPQYLP